MHTYAYEHIRIAKFRQNMELDKRITELAERSRQRQIFTYTDFVNEQTQANIKRAFSPDFVTFYGGTDFAERKIARFGCEVAYDEEFPLKIVEITLLGGRFSKPVTHRDVLGAIMSCGVERDKVGDILVGEHIYAVLYDTICEHIVRELTQIGRNNVEVKIVTTVCDDAKPKFDTVKIPAQSNRLDAITCKLYNLSREKAAELCEQGKLAIDGVPCEKGSRSLKAGETVSARGYGKFRFDGENGQSKKGKTYFIISAYK